MPEISIQEWDTFLENLPEAHLLQTGAWGKLKQDFGWQARYLSCEKKGSLQLGAQILFRQLPFGRQIAYIPKGPAGWIPENDQSWEAWREFVLSLDKICQKEKAILVILEPDLWMDQLSVQPPGFSKGSQTIQPSRTLVVDLSGGEQSVLARMKQKTRYNIRLAQKKGVTAVASQDVDTFYRLMTTTGNRDSFGVHSKDYYQDVFDVFHPGGACELFIASYQEEPLAGLMVFRHGRRAWYFYGASSDTHRELMPTYLIQWEAMLWAMQFGCTEYDLWGVPDENEEILESEFTNRSDGLWGVYRFKRGFGGELRRSAGPFERIYQPALYRIYVNILKMKRQSIG